MSANCADSAGETPGAAGRLPRRTSLASETAATLKEWITTGVLREELPGELQLKSRLGVGRDTLRLALQALTEAGWISPASKGRQRRVQAAHVPARKSAARDILPVTFLSPYPIVHRVTLLELEDLRIGLAGQGRSLRFVAPEVFHLKRPERQLERLMRDQPSAAWVLNEVSEPIQRWFDENEMPAFLFGTPYPEVKLPFVVADWGMAAFHAGTQLVQQGHRIIGVLQYQERFPGLVAEERGLQQALAEAGSDGRVLLFKDDRSPASVARSIETAFGLKERPTALVLSRAAQVPTCLSWMASRGIRTPGDVSIVSLADDSWFTEFHPPVAYYRTNSKTIAEHIAERVLELVSAGRVTKKSVRVELEYVPGATIGPVPNDRGPLKISPPTGGRALAASRQLKSLASPPE
jgi:LacI family transcriptional regulator